MIGIITFDQAVNYGAVLQMYALQQILEELGIENIVIRYRCEKIIQRHLLKRKWWNPIGYHLKKKTRDLFTQFINENIHSSPFLSSLSLIDSMEVKIDTCIVGSDQVCNENLTGYDRAYFLEGLPEHIRRVSYAASMGKYRFTDKKEEQNCIENLKKFEKISVREESLCRYLKGTTLGQEREIYVHPDPVLLLDADGWRTRMGQKVSNEQPYILLYMIGRDENCIRKAQALSKETHQKVIWLSDSLRYYSKITNKRCCGPQKFIQTIANSAYVVTNSFHGTAFSLIFQKPFFTTPSKEGKREERIADLLDAVEVPETLLGEKPENWQRSVWETVEENLTSLRKSAINYLNKM